MSSSSATAPSDRSSSGPTTNDTASTPPTAQSSQAAVQNAQQLAESRAAVTTTLESVGSAYDSDLARRAHDLHSNSQAITTQEKQLQKETAKLRKENDKLEKLLGKGLGGVKEVGDVQNWAEGIERSLLVLEETMRLVDEKEGRGRGQAAGT